MKSDTDVLREKMECCQKKYGQLKKDLSAALKRQDIGKVKFLLRKINNIEAELNRLKNRMSNLDSQEKKAVSSTEDAKPKFFNRTTAIATA